MDRTVGIFKDVAELDAIDRRELLGVCYPLACDGFGQEPSPELLRETEETLFTGDEILLLHEGDEKGKVIAFLSSSTIQVGEKRVLYLIGLMVAKSVQGQGCGSTLVKLAWKRSGADLVTALTQSPVMYATLLRLGFRVYPNASQPTPPELLDIVEVVAQERNITGGSSPCIYPELYGHSLYGLTPYRSGREVDDFLLTLLRPEEGDAILLIAERLPSMGGALTADGN